MPKPTTPSRKPPPVAPDTYVLQCLARRLRLDGPLTARKVVELATSSMVIDLARARKVDGEGAAVEIEKALREDCEVAERKAVEIERAAVEARMAVEMARTGGPHSVRLSDAAVGALRDALSHVRSRDKMTGKEVRALGFAWDICIHKNKWQGGPLIVGGEAVVALPCEEGKADAATAPTVAKSLPTPAPLSKPKRPTPGAKPVPTDFKMPPPTKPSRKPPPVAPDSYVLQYLAWHLRDRPEARAAVEMARTGGPRAVLLTAEAVEVLRDAAAQAFFSDSTREDEKDALRLAESACDEWRKGPLVVGGKAIVALP